MQPPLSANEHVAQTNPNVWDVWRKARVCLFKTCGPGSARCWLATGVVKLVQSLYATFFTVLDQVRRARKSVTKIILFIVILLLHTRFRCYFRRPPYHLKLVAVTSHFCSFCERLTILGQEPFCSPGSKFPGFMHKFKHVYGMPLIYTFWSCESLSCKSRECYTPKWAHSFVLRVFSLSTKSFHSSTVFWKQEWISSE